MSGRTSRTSRTTSRTSRTTDALVARESRRSLAWARASIWLAATSLIVFLPEAMSRWFLPKEALFAVAAVAASVAVRRGRLPRWMLVLIAVSVLLLAVGVLFSAAPWASFWGRWPRYEGLVSLPVYIVAVFVGARLLGPERSEPRVESWWAAMATASLLLAAVGALEAFGLDPIPTNLERPGSLVGNATDQGILGAAFFAMLLPPALARWRNGDARRPWLVSAGALAGVLTVVVSASRAAFLGMLVAVLVIVVLTVWGARLRSQRAGEPGSRRRALRGAGIGAGAVLALTALALAVPLTRDRLLGLSPLSGRTVSDRVMIWDESMRLIAADPLTGTGPSGFIDAVPRMHDAEWFRVVGPDTVLDSPHNVLLQGAFGGGVLLALVLLGAGIGAVVAGVRGWRRSALVEPVHPPAGRSHLLEGSVAAIISIAVALMTSFTAPATAILGGLLVGVVVARVPRREAVGAAMAAGRGRPDARLRALGTPTLGRAAVTGALALWAVALCITAVAEIPLNQGISAARSGDIASAESAFRAASALRPWDADLASIAAQTLANEALDGSVEAAPLAEVWAQTALGTTPDSVPTLKALAAAQHVRGDLAAEQVTLERVVELAPADPDAAELLAEVTDGR